MMYQFNDVLIKISIDIFPFFRNWQVGPKIHMDLHKTKNSQNNLENKMGRFT